MPSGSRLALFALLAVLASLAVTATAVPATAGTGAVQQTDGGIGDAPNLPVDAGSPAIAVDDARESNTTMRVRLTDDGDANWEVTARVNLTDQADRDAFQDLGEAFVAGETDTRWLTVFQRAQVATSRETGRQMDIRNADRDWSIDERDGNATGQVTLTFTWTNFARVTEDGRRLVVDDAFQTSGGTWLERLDTGQTLVIQPPAGYSPVSGGGDLRERSFHWEGPEDFADGPPSAVFVGGGLPTLLVASLVVAGLALLLVFVYLLASRREVLVDRGSDDDTDDGAGAAAAETTEEKPEDGAAAAEGDGEAGDEVDVALLSDEERVERLLERNGGRMKQASIVKETGWSNAKVSQLLSAMEEEGRIDKLRIGRENLISFPDEDVADVEE